MSESNADRLASIWRSLPESETRDEVRSDRVEDGERIAFAGVSRLPVWATRGTWKAAFRIEVSSRRLTWRYEGWLESMDDFDGDEAPPELLAAWERFRKTWKE